jgi:hypothetical protein
LPPRPQYTDAPTLALKELLDLIELQKLGQKAKAPERTCAQYIDDPLGFIDNCVRWPTPRRKSKTTRPPGLAPYQRDIMASVPEEKRVAVRGPRGLGKSALASLTLLWFAITRDAGGVDWKVVTTAGSWAQLTGFLWVEIKKWAYCLNWETIGRGPLSERNELMKTGLALRHGVALAGSPDQPEKLEGAHADSVLYIFDESKIIAAETFDAAEGAFSGAGDDSDLEAFALAISTPGECAGRFYEIHRHAAGLEDWHTRHVTLEEAIAAGRMTRSWAEQRRRLWGERSALYQNHVLGEFCSEDEDAVIPLAWVEAAQLRWAEWDAAGRPDQDGQHIIGVDVARSGRDKSIAAVRHGDVITRLVAWSKEDTMETVGRVKGMMDADPLATSIVDVIGIGAGVYDRLREMGLKVDPFNAAKKTTRKDVTRQFGFTTLRSAAWWNLRELLDPSRPGGSTVALPPDDELAGDLTALHKKYMSEGKIQVESKDDIKKRIGRSTDKGDAVMQSFFTVVGSFHDIYGTEMCPDEKCGRGFAKNVNGKPRDRCPYCNAPLETEDDAEEAA